MIPNNINKITKEYTDVENSIITQLSLDELIVDVNQPMVSVKYTSKKFNASGNPLQKDSLLAETVNVKPVSKDTKYALNSTLVDSTTGEIYGELAGRNSKQVRSIQTKQIIGQYDPDTQILSIYNPDYTIDGSEPQYLGQHNVTGEANFVINVVQSGQMGIFSLILGMFDRIVEQNLV